MKKKSSRDWMGKIVNKAADKPMPQEAAVDPKRKRRAMMASNLMNKGKK